MKKTALLMMLLLLILTAFGALAESTEEFEYTLLEDGTAKVTAWKGEDAQECVIPGELDGHLVTGIGRGAFYGRKELVNLTLPETLTAVEDYAFYMCHGLYSLTIPEAVTSIGSHAFGACSGLKYLTFEGGVPEIGEFAFAACTSLETLILPEGTQTIGGYAFSQCTGLRSVLLPQSIEQVARYAFSGCALLEKVLLPEGISGLDGEAFAYCGKVQLSASNESVTADLQETKRVVLRMLTAGEVIPFGSYEQDGRSDNGREPIEWRVLLVDGETALLQSVYALDAQPYHEKEREVTWETSSLRAFLNGTFFENAFDSSEKALILTTEVVNGKAQGSEKWSSNGGRNTEDKVYLLSYAETLKMFPNTADRVVKATDYAVQQGVNVDENDGCTWYWMRSPGRENAHGAIVRPTGSIGSFYTVDYKNGGVRPCIRISLVETE
ncbi:MAG: leucine-rich repeat domain-containing protein [Clostridia bacterium]|nr:leucine-rich repeat domain-containing protein [Clostridia bacterium]